MGKMLFCFLSFLYINNTFFVYLSSICLQIMNKPNIQDRTYLALIFNLQGLTASHFLKHHLLNYYSSFRFIYLTTLSGWIFFFKSTTFSVALIALSLFTPRLLRYKIASSILLLILYVFLYHFYQSWPYSAHHILKCQG